MKASELEELGQILIVGMARSGIAAALAVRRILPQIRTVIADRDPEPADAGEQGRLEEAGVQVELGREDHTLLDGCGLVIKSPGVPGDIPLILEAHQRGIPVWGEVEFAWRFLKNPFIGITGTNGKTTTTELVGHILRQASWRCRVAGNVGTPVSSLVGVASVDEILVVELSSFQLEDSIELRPDVAVLLNLAEDHLDRHPGIDQYIAAKMLIFSNQGHDDLAVLNLDDPAISERAVPGNAAQAWFSSGPLDLSEKKGRRQPLVYMRDGDICYDQAGLVAAGAGVRSKLGPYGPTEVYSGGRNGTGKGEDSEKVISWPEAGLRGEHNLENSLAAAAVCLGIGVPAEDVAAGLRSFPGVPHRLQQVAVIRGVTYVNDSKATNVDAAIKALTAYEGGIHLILGGSLKGCSFDRLVQAASPEKVMEVLLIGQAASSIKDSFERAGRKAVVAGELGEAVRLAQESAVEGDIVLLSPACASFDQYSNYEERGAHFINLVNQIETRQG